MTYEKQEGPPNYPWPTWFMVMAANLALTICQIMAYTAVKMLPLCDFVVLAFTSPVFALIASGIILRSVSVFLRFAVCPFPNFKRLTRYGHYQVSK